MGIPSQRYLSKKAETRGRSQKRQEKSYRKWGYFTKEEWAIAQKNPQKASFQSYVRKVKMLTYSEKKWEKRCNGRWQHHKEKTLSLFSTRDQVIMGIRMKEA